MACILPDVVVDSRNLAVLGMRLGQNLNLSAIYLYLFLQSSVAKCGPHTGDTTPACPMFK